MAERLRTGRIGILDELRGLALINMIVYHVLYDLGSLYNRGPDWMFTPATEIWQEYICISFILIAGICAPYGKSPLKHALVVIGCAIGISLVTYTFMPKQFIIFGILHMIGVSLLIYVILKSLLARVNNLLGLGISLILVVLTWNTVNGYFGIGDFSIQLPVMTDDYLSPLGLTSKKFSSADYFPLLPYFFVFSSGVFLSDWVKTWPTWLKKTHIGPLADVGRSTLVLYLLHQPIILSVLYIYFNYLVKII